MTDTTARKQAEEALQANRETERSFCEQLTALHEVNLALSQASSFGELCRRAVEMGSRCLDFDRLGLWFCADELHRVQGSFGIDEYGEVRDERSERLLVSAHSLMGQALAHKAPVVCVEDTPLLNHHAEQVGYGSHAIATLWDGAEIIGCLCADNLLRGRPFQEHQRKLLGLYAATLGHLCARKRTEEALQESREMLLQAQKMQSIGTLAGGIAHDFNNLLQVILGFTGLLREEKREDDPDIARLDSIEKAAHRGTELISQLLTFSRMQPMNSRPVSLHSVIQETHALLEHTLPRSIRLSLSLDALPDRVIGDPNRLEQALMNLCLNARDAMPDGGDLTIATFYQALEDESPLLPPAVRAGRYIVLSVQDSGKGIDPAIQDRLFEPFFTTKAFGQGTGLGLAMVYGIAQSHNGFVRVHNEPGRGANFSLTLPAVEEEAPPK